MQNKASSNITDEDWFIFGEHEFSSAKLLYEQEGHSDVIAFLLQQATEKYLKGYLLTKGWKLKKIHDLEVLITEAINFNQKFENYLDYARLVSSFYIKSRYPTGIKPGYPRKQTAALLRQAEKLIDLIKRETVS